VLLFVEVIIMKAVHFSSHWLTTISHYVFSSLFRCSHSFICVWIQ